MPSKALEAVFDECDRYEVDETGGRLIGTYSESDSVLTVSIQGVIEPGARARRSNTSFFQDGDYQESVFRNIERAQPNVEHLGNWHTHHVNGFGALSAGDVQTYQRTVNHVNHNTSFFYALLVTAKEGPRSKDRYRVKHYLLRRGDPNVYEIDQRNVERTDGPLLWPAAEMSAHAVPSQVRTVAPHAAGATTPPLTERAYDSAVLRDFYSHLRAFKSAKVGVYWRGPIELSDGSDLPVLIVEDASGPDTSYSIGLPEPGERLKDVAVDLDERRFPSARAALIHAERACNRALFLSATRTPTSAN